MRKILIAMGMLAAVTLLPGAPAQAELGCGCVKLGAAPYCAATVAQCMSGGGLCLAPCDYQAPKKMAKRHAKKKKKM